MARAKKAVEGPVFGEAGIRFLRGLKRHNDREWFNARKAIYEAELKRPMLRLIEVVNEEMLRWAPEHVRAPEKVMMRIYRDIRFSKDKRPYKTHVAAWWARQGMEKTSGAGFYLDVSGEQVRLGAGVFVPEREQLLKLRQFLVERHAEVRQAMGSARLKRLGFSAVAGQPLTRPPKGFADAGAADDLVRQREWGVGADVPVEDAMQPGFAEAVSRKLEACAPVVYLLNEPLVVRRSAGVVVDPLRY